MDIQFFFNIVVVLLCVLGAFILRVVWDGLKQLRETDSNLVCKVCSIENLVAGPYVKREEFVRITEQMFNKLDHISIHLATRFEALRIQIEGKLDRNN